MKFIKIMSDDNATVRVNADHIVSYYRKPGSGQGRAEDQTCLVSARGNVRLSNTSVEDIDKMIGAVSVAEPEKVIRCSRCTKPMNHHNAIKSKFTHLGLICKECSIIDQEARKG